MAWTVQQITAVDELGFINGYEVGALNAMIDFIEIQGRPGVDGRLLRKGTHHNCDFCGESAPLLPLPRTDVPAQWDYVCVPCRRSAQY